MLVPIQIHIGHFVLVAFKAAFGWRWTDELKFVKFCLLIHFIGIQRREHIKLQFSICAVNFFLWFTSFASPSQSLGNVFDKTVFWNFYGAYLCFVFVIDLGREVYKILCQIEMNYNYKLCMPLMMMFWLVIWELQTLLKLLGKDFIGLTCFARYPTLLSLLIWIGIFGFRGSSICEFFSLKSLAALYGKHFLK